MDDKKNVKRFEKEDLDEALKVLQSGGIILYPTDTIWGLGCDATNAAAVSRIFQLKQRADEKAMLVLLDSPAKLQAYVQEVPDMAWDLIEMTTKPLTIIYPDARNLAQNLVSADQTVGIRITDELFSKTLCERFRKPIVSTSANISGSPAPGNFSEIADEIKSGVDYIVRYRQEETDKPKPSSIILLGKGNLIKIIRE